MDIGLVSKLAHQVRTAIELIPKDKLPFPMADFPRASCGDATLLLGAFLSDNGFPSFLYVCGERGSHEDETWTTHAWLAAEGIAVDITADQFPDAPNKVIVTHDSQWHAQFNGKEAGTGDFRKWTGPGTHHLYQAYGLISEVLKVSQ